MLESLIMPIGYKSFFDEADSQYLMSRFNILCRERILY
ncbi:hypothetical protein J5U23_01849 [Saccharolobus shibatae B12]|uniref:Uncharacterized protein n=1 Tax=Saccharolobus shibatae (strain ATCC 51178 / DSM 5389 / JCM 8931 / NBRC 15437 / B12) TaxID=523848 RepID=A0A8F5GTK1_SACSH|nr:hypothetical protein J5U23_01849 [Saccharolobus shibatae B12]